jgi:hypothetical protein
MCRVLWHGVNTTIVTDNTVFPKYDVLGWYSTGADVLPSDTAIHDKARASTGNVDRAPKAHRADPFGAAIAARITALCAISDRGVQRKPSLPSLRHRCLSDYEGPAHEGAQTTCGRCTTDGCSDKMHVGMQIKLMPARVRRACVTVCARDGVCVRVRACVRADVCATCVRPCWRVCVRACVCVGEHECGCVRACICACMCAHNTMHSCIPSCKASHRRASPAGI